MSDKSNESGVIHKLRHAKLNPFESISDVIPKMSKCIREFYAFRRFWIKTDLFPEPNHTVI